MWDVLKGLVNLTNPASFSESFTHYDSVLPCGKFSFKYHQNRKSFR